jgi:hypothetical protein
LVETLSICCTGNEVEDEVVNGCKVPPAVSPCAVHDTPQVIVAVTENPASFGSPFGDGSPADDRL